MNVKKIFRLIIEKFSIYRKIIRLKIVIPFIFGIIFATLIPFIYKSVQSIRADKIFEQAILEEQKANNSERAIELINKANELIPKDIYFRKLSEIYLKEFSQSLNKLKKEESDELLELTIRNLEKAIEIAPDNYFNWFILGKTYTAFIQSNINVEGSKKAAREAYSKALSLKIPDIDKAEIYFLLSQIDIIEEKNNEAISYLEKAIEINPNNASYYLQLGIIKFRAKEYERAIDIFNRALIIIPDYSDVRYFLGLSYYAIGDINKSIKEFEYINKTNPENKEIRLILQNLRHGLSPIN